MRTLKTIFAKAVILNFVFNFVFAVEVGSEMELTRLVNARYTALFRSIDANIRAQLPKGTYGEVKEIKRFDSGNSGILLKIKEGVLANELVWIHYNPNLPSLKAFNPQGGELPNPVADANARTLRAVSALRDPASPSLAANSNQNTAAAETVPGTIIQLNQDIGKLNGRTPPCTECATAAAAPGITGASQTLRSGIQVSQRPDGKLDARVKCTHTANYGSHSGKFEAIIENNRVLHLDAQIGNGRCRIHSDEFKQVEMPNNNIVLKNAAGCTVVFGNHNYNRPGLRDKPTLNFGVVQIGGGPCEKICGDFMSKAFWQVAADPRTQVCD